MTWIPLTDEGKFNEIIRLSHEKPQVIFKHSTRCSISSVAMRRLENATCHAPIDFHYLDIFRHRELSNTIADALDVYHESPQVILIIKGACVYEESHLGISMDEICELSVTSAMHD
ncbi:MAG: bacillithiol system redox-active protein YtxJ [Terrimonas sp.]|nr:bacillithiol system redox-active protein YtxJ [Terrimonas sp.]